MKKVRVLSLDGGGMRGIIPATVVEYIEKKLQEKTKNNNVRIADYFDIIVGTSTGGILTCFYLAPNENGGENEPNAKYTASQALEFYSEKGYDIFNKSKHKSWFGFRQLFNSTQYKPQAIEKIFSDTLGNLQLTDLLKQCLVTTYNIESKTSFFFSNKENEEKKRAFYVRDVVRSTSAAPTYFPPAEITNLATNTKMINIDGGVFALAQRGGGELRHLQSGGCPSLLRAYPPFRRR
jgi:patatin-like phospholipase/acyl hydrolase